MRGGGVDPAQRDRGLALEHLGGLVGFALGAVLPDRSQVTMAVPFMRSSNR